MQLSMWILADWLKDYHPEVKIENGDRILRNVRLYAEGLKLSRFTVYLNQIDGQKAMCSNGRDILILQTDDLNEVFNRILDAFEYYNEWQENMNTCISYMRPLKELMDMFTSVFHSVLIMADATFFMREVCGSREDKEYLTKSQQILEDKIMPLEDLLRINQLDHIRKSNVPAYLVSVPDRETSAVTNLFSDNKHIGWLILLAPGGEYSQGTLDLLDVAGEFVEKWFSRNRESDLTMDTAGIFQDIMSDTLTEKQMYTSLDTMGWYPSDAKQLYLILQTDDLLEAHHAVRRYLEMLNTQAYLFTYDGNMLYILNKNLTDEHRLESQMKEILKKSHCCAVKSPAFTDILLLKKYAKSLQVLADFLDMDPGKVISVEESRLPYIASLLARQTVLDMKHPSLYLLEEYDRKNDTQLSQTLCCFLKNNCSYIETAKELYIHRSTLLYRLNRIRELTELDLDNYDVRLSLQISYLIRVCGKQRM